MTASPWSEWRTWAERLETPSDRLHVFREDGSIERYPEVAALIGCPQDPTWHPEGDVWTHTLHVCDAAAHIARRDEVSAQQRAVLLLAALCHDLGKPATTVMLGGRWRSPGHAALGVAPTEALLARINCPPNVVAATARLVREHMAYLDLPLRARPVRRLIARLAPATIPQWARLVEADHSGRPPLPPDAPAAPFVALAEGLAASTEEDRPAPILTGRQLLAAGVSPGPRMGQSLQDAYDAQLCGLFDSVESGLRWIEDHTADYTTASGPSDDTLVTDRVVLDAS